MGSWKIGTLGDVLTLQRGFDITKKQVRKGTVPVVSSSGVSYWHDEARAAGPGVVVGRKGSLGTVYWQKEAFWPHDTTLWVRDFKGNDPYFCYLLLKTLRLQDLDVGASNPTLNRNHAHQVAISYPSRAVQHRIGAFLGTFDELIEINERQIDISQALTDSLYRHWFVQNRFPGHSGMDLVDSAVGSIPLSWTVRAFSELAEFRNGFAFKPSHRRESGLPIIKIRELKQGVTAATPRCSEAEIDPEFIVEPGDLLFSWSADLGVYLWPGERGALNQHLFKVHASDTKMQAFVFHALKRALPEFKARAQGTTMRHIKRSALSEVEVPVPTDDLLATFARRVEPLHAYAVTLRREDEALARVRDLLLPRLVTGQLDISDIDLGALTPSEFE